MNPVTKRQWGELFWAGVCWAVFYWAVKIWDWLP